MLIAAAASPAFEFMPLLSTLIGTFAGALVAILMLWLKEVAERRRAINDWFENNFLFGSVEPLLHKSRRCIGWTEADAKGDSPAILDEEVLSKLERVSQLLRDETFCILWTCASQHLQHGEYNHASPLFQGLVMSLMELQDALLVTTIKKRQEVFTLCNKAVFIDIIKKLKIGENAYLKTIKST